VDQHGCGNEAGFESCLDYSGPPAQAWLGRRVLADPGTGLFRARYS
jgi:hypothetical protein